MKTPEIIKINAEFRDNHFWYMYKVDQTEHHCLASHSVEYTVARKLSVATINALSLNVLVFICSLISQRVKQNSC